MGKNFKIFSSVIALIVLLLFITVILLGKLIDPNNYRNQIEQFVYSKTGRQIDIQGQIRWSFFPRLGINLPEVTIGNPKGIEGPHFAHIENLNLEARLFSLFMGKIEIDEVNVENAKINLIIEKNNLNNWHQWHVADQPKLTFYASLAKPTLPPKKINAAASLPIRSMRITNVSIKNSRIQIIDRRNDQIYQFRNLDLNINDFDSNRDFPLQLAFDFKPSDSSILLQHRLNATAHIDTQKQRLLLPEFSMTTLLVRPELGKLPIDVEGKLELNWAQKTLKIADLSIQLANMLLKGTLEISRLSQNPLLHASLQSQGTALKPLLAALSGSSAFTGKMNFNTTLTAEISNLQKALNTLHGDGKIEVTDGVIDGINLNLLFRQATAYAEKSTAAVMPDPAPNVTAFSHIHAGYIIQNGVLQNNDLDIRSDEITTRGAGTINLDDSTVNYKLDIQYSSKKPTDILLPIIITGTLSNPRIIPDFKKIAEKYFKHAISDFIGDKSNQAKEALKNLMP